MSKRTRRAASATGSRAARRAPKPQRRRLPMQWLALAAAVVIVGLAAVAVELSNRAPTPSPSAVATQPAASAAPAGLAGIQTGAPPWPPEITHLKARLAAIGLPALTAEGVAQHTHQHLEVFIDGQPVPVPADIGINAAAGFLSPIHTHDATGIIHVESPVVRDFTLGEFFDVWGVRFDGHCIGGECDGGGRTLSVYVNGQPFAGDPHALVLAAHQEVVVVLGTQAQVPNPIPSSYRFPAGL
jgi:hypothetical protein